MAMDRYRFALGACVVIGLVILAIFIALGHVEEKSSYGLTAIIAIIAKVVLDFSAWAFRLYKDPGEDPKGDE